MPYKKEQIIIIKFASLENTKGNCLNQRMNFKNLLSNHI